MRSVACIVFDKKKSYLKHAQRVEDVVEGLVNVLLVDVRGALLYA